MSAPILMPTAKVSTTLASLVKNMTGEGKVITVTVNAMKEKFTDTKPFITSRPSYVPLNIPVPEILLVAATGNIAISVQCRSVICFCRKLIVSNSPMVQFGKNLNYLVNYPYGCVEQTVSAAFPQLYYADLTRNHESK
jgi:hypothetical protein